MANKYGNKLCTFDENGEVLKFSSMAERRRYIYLSDLQQRGLISDLSRQPRFLLIERFVRHAKKFQAEYYVADFQYQQDYQTIVEDVKGVSTAAYLGKRKHFLKLNPDIVFLEVRLKGFKWEITEL